ncbi:hypothetical protein ACN47E_010050 [Coniothyrium glycines]
MTPEAAKRAFEDSVRAEILSLVKAIYGEKSDVGQRFDVLVVQEQGRGDTHAVYKSHVIDYKTKASNSKWEPLIERQEQESSGQALEDLLVFLREYAGKVVREKLRQRRG